MNTLEVGDMLYHPCSMDIISHKVVEVRMQDGGIIIYKIKAIHNVGACGRVESLVAQTGDDYFTFIELLTEGEYVGGLKDFVEGRYYKDKNQAKIEFYDIQRTLAWSKVDELERRLRDAKEAYERFEKIIKEAKEGLMESKKEES